MGLTKEEQEKVPDGLSLKEYYERIYSWHLKNKNRIFTKYPGRNRDDPYIQCYLELMEIIPKSNLASPEDIAFVCREVIAGLMEWGYHEEDENGIKIAAYAHHVLDTFYDGFDGTRTLQLSKNSKFYPKYNAKSCLANKSKG